MLFFGMINYLYKHFQIEACVVEVGDVQWMQSWIQKNKELLDIEYKEIHCVPIQQDRYRWISHIKTFLGLSPYRKYTKIFGGGELFDATKSFPHNGWNILILYRYSIIARNYLLLWGIGETKLLWAKIVQKILLRAAKYVICRDVISHQRAKKYAEKRAVLYHDFSLDIYPKYAHLHPSNKTILLNAPFSDQLSNFLEKYNSSTINYLFFPCEWIQDYWYISSLRQRYPRIHIYDWTKNSLLATLKIFAQSCCGVGSRLHFCLPLEYYEVPYLCVSNNDKHRKLLLAENMIP